MKVRELKELLSECTDDMEVVIPVWNETHVNAINHLWKITTAAIIHQLDETDKALVLNTSNGELENVSDQIDRYNPLDITCEKVLN